MTLADYLQAGVRLRWEPGKHDCCVWPAGWALTWGRGDPMARWRGRYRSDAGAVRLVRQEGGMLALWRQGLADIGIPEVGELEPGDVGVVDALTEYGLQHVGAIWTGSKWAFAARDGLMFARADCLAAWGPRDV